MQSELPIITTGLIGNVGLVFDISGAFFLAASFVLKHQDKLLKETRTYMDGNPFALPSAIAQTVEARLGAFLLAVGFFGQFIAYTGWVSNGKDDYPTWVLLAGAAAFIGLWFSVSSHIRHKARRAVAREWGKSMTRALDQSPRDKLSSLCEFYAGALGLKRREGESDEGFKTRIIRSIESWT